MLVCVCERMCVKTPSIISKYELSTSKAHADSLYAPHSAPQVVFIFDLFFSSHRAEAYLSYFTTI